MNIRLALITLLITVVPTLHAYPYDEIDYIVGQWIINYPSHLEKRRNMPETKEEYLKRIEAGLKHLDKHLERTVKDDYDWSVTGPLMRDLKWEIDAKWKKGWWDHNPGWGDLICVSSILTALGILIKIANANNGGGAGAPPAGGNNPPPAQIPEAA